MKLVVLILLPILSLCWGDVGHMLTALIAQIKLNDLNPQAALHFKELINSINALCDNRTRTFVESACWPDDLKTTKNMRLFDQWHYKDVPFLTDTVGPIVNQTQMVINSLSTMRAAVSVLKINLFKNTAERALFARYFIHIIGDIHQPLHSAALYNRTFPSGDLGGNLIKVTLEDGSLANFHLFWDYGANLLQNESWAFIRPMNQQNMTILLNLATKMISKYGCELQQLGKILDPIVWSQQSFEFSKNTSYPFLRNTNKITRQYTDLVYLTSLKRITLAGFRMANYISDLYKQVSPPNTHVKSQCKRKPRFFDQNFNKDQQSKISQKPHLKLRKTSDGISDY